MINQQDNTKFEYVESYNFYFVYTNLFESCRKSTGSARFIDYPMFFDQVFYYGLRHSGRSTRPGIPPGTTARRARRPAAKGRKAAGPLRPAQAGHGTVYTIWHRSPMPSYILLKGNISVPRLPTDGQRPKREKRNRNQIPDTLSPSAPYRISNDRTCGRDARRPARSA